MENIKKVLVIGPTGNFGAAVLTALTQRKSFSVRVMLRPGRAPLSIPGVESVFGDATSETDLMRATLGMDVVVYGFHAGYVGWETTLIPAARVMAQVAISRGLRIVYPGNVYGLRPSDDGRPLDENAELTAPTEKGRIRNRIEELFAQSAKDGARLLIVRAGDYFGPESHNTWLDFFTKDAVDGGALSCPEMAPVPHAWAYLPDVGNTVAALLENEDRMGPCETFHFRGHVESPLSMMQTASDILGSRQIRRVPWFALSLVQMFSPLLREILPMRYLWQKEIVLDDGKLRNFLGEVPHTDLKVALQRTLLPRAAQKSAA